VHGNGDRDLYAHSGLIREATQLRIEGGRLKLRYTPGTWITLEKKFSGLAKKLLKA
jgi:hypothetical protein